MNRYRILGFIFLLVLSIVSAIPGYSQPDPSRNSSGVNNLPATDPLSWLTVPSQCDLIQFFEDFNVETSNPAYIFSGTNYTTAVADGTIKNWVLTRTATGTASTTINNSTLQIINGTADNDNNFIQLNRDLFMPTVGKKLFFEAKIRCTSDITNSDIVCGLMPTDTTPLGGYGIFFQKDDAATNFTFRNSCASGVSAVSPSLTIADDTWYKLNFFYDGVQTTSFWINDTFYGVAGFTRFPTASYVKPIVGLQNGDANSTILEVDYIYAAQER